MMSPLVMRLKEGFWCEWAIWQEEKLDRLANKVDWVGFPIMGAGDGAGA
jgi:hypothetical protein